MLKKILTFLLFSALPCFAQMSGSGTQSGSAGIWLTAAGNPLPSANLLASSTTPAQGASITLTYTTSGATSCNINNGILATTTTCNGTTASFVPPFVAPGPTSTVYTLTAFNGSGQVGVNVTVTVAATSTSGDDSTYSTGINELCSYPGGVTTDGPADLPKQCNYTPLSSTPSPGTARTVGYSGGVLTPATCTTDWNTAMSALVAGDVVKVAQGCVITCAGSTGCIIPSIHGDWSHWTTIKSVDPATGNPDTGFPAEGKRISPCDIGLATLAYYPSYSTDCVARGGAKIRTFKILSAGTTVPALAISDGTLGVSPVCNATTYPCSSYIRIIGLEATNLNATTRTSHKLLEFQGCDHCIADRVILHSLNDPLFRVEVQGGVNINGSHESVINSYIYDIVCANAPTGGSTCIDSQGIAGGTGNFPQAGHKLVNNFIAATGESWFWGGSQSGYYPTAQNSDGGASDIEVRRNHTFKPLSWLQPYAAGPFTLTSVNTTGTYTGTIFGGNNNALVGKTFKVGGFVNTANNIFVKLCTGSTNTTISFAGNTTIAETHAGTATNVEPDWDPKNNGETKASNRSLWEANISENSWEGFQSDQFGNTWLLTPKNQNSPLAIPAGDVVTGENVAGLHYLNCTNGGVSCSSVGKGLFNCELDPNAVPDWTGNGTTVASCGKIVAFPCPAGTQVGCLGSYIKRCASVTDQTKCAVTIGSIYTGIFYHILNYISPDQVQIQEDATATVAATPVMFHRALNPFAAVRNHTMRYSIARHTADGIENSTGQDGGGAEALGIHNVSLHDLEFYDINPTFWTNQNTCCNQGWTVKILSSTSVPAYVPSDITIQHITSPVIGWNISQVSGLAAWFDNLCKNPQPTPTTCANGVVPAYFPRMKIKDNISGAALHIINGSGNFGTITQLYGANLYGCTNHAGSGCDYDIQKNLLVTNVWPGQSNQLPNLNLLGSNSVEACSCTTAANGGSCTPGSPNTWSTPVVSGSIDACDRNPASGYGSIFNNWDPAGGPLIDLQLPSNSPYKLKASDGTDLGANIPQIAIKTANVATAVNYTQIAINGYIGNTTCNDLAPCALPAATHGVFYSQTLSRTTPNGPFTQWKQTAGTLPAGMQLVMGTGVIWGTPSVAGTYTFSIQAEDPSHSIDLQAFSWVVN